MAKPAKVRVRVSTQPLVVMEAEVVRKIRQHARTSMKAEVCGVLIGNTEHERMTVEACIAGINAAQGGAHVTFTQDTWEHIYKIKDKDYPEQKIVGWYHSHPGFGVFLSEHDLFIQQNFFSNPQQIAWVYDPHTDEEGCFGWVGGSIEKLTSLRMGYSQAVEITSGGGSDYDAENDDTVVDSLVRSHRGKEPEEPAWLPWARQVMGYITAIGLGFVLCFTFLNWRLGPTFEKARRFDEIMQLLQQQQHDQLPQPGPAVSGAEGGADGKGQAGPSASGSPQTPSSPHAGKAAPQKGNNGKH
jgi:proteasome lid subunit RPN8/RPN11